MANQDVIAVSTHAKPWAHQQIHAPVTLYEKQRRSKLQRVRSTVIASVFVLDDDEVRRLTQDQDHHGHNLEQDAAMK